MKTKKAGAVVRVTDDGCYFMEWVESESFLGAPCLTGGGITATTFEDMVNKLVNYLSSQLEATPTLEESIAKLEAEGISLKEDKNE